MKQLPIFFLALFSLLSTFATASEQPLTPYAGEAKDFSLVDFSGKQHQLDDYTGKVLLINFWASWCPPCIHEMPELQRLKQHFSDQPFEIIAINVGEKKYKVRKFSKLINLELPVLLDTKSATFDQWGVKTLPTSFLLDTEGNIVYQVRGNPGWNQQQTRDIISDMILTQEAFKNTETKSLNK